MQKKSSKPEATELRLGFYLARTTVRCEEWPDIAYRGIDRLPYALSPDEIEDLRDAGRHRLADLWEEYCDADELGHLRQDIDLARGLQQRFLTEGAEYEIIYVELTETPKNLDQYPSAALWKEEMAGALKAFQSTLNERPKETLDFLGYDLSTLHSSFHSAIYQPGLHDVYPTLSLSLNQNGLFDGINDARRFLHGANEMDYGPLPFCIFAVWEAA